MIYRFSMKRDDVKTLDRTIRVLAVAPYEGMRILIEHESRKFLELKVDIVTGNLEEGVRKAQASFHADYDLILSRGGTAEMLRRQVDIPVVEIPISFFDILCSIQLSSNAGRKRAMVGFASITKNVQLINDLLNLDLDIYTLVDPSDIDAVVAKLIKKKYDAVLCDVVSAGAVQNAGLNAILVTSRADSIDEALNDVLSLSHSLNRLRTENHFLRAVLREHSGETVVFNANQDLYFSTFAEDEHPEIIAMLKELIPEVQEGTGKHIWKSLKGHLYSIKSAVFTVDQENYTSFYLFKNKSGTGAKNTAVRYYTRKEAEAVYQNSFYHLGAELTRNPARLNAVAAAGTPLVITGEYGTGRRETADCIYINSLYRQHSLIEIDCGKLNDKTMSFLLDSVKSPLYDTGNTIHFLHMEQASEKNIQRLINTLDSMNLCAHNLVIFSGDPESSPFGSHLTELKNLFRCYQIQLPPLREAGEQIPAIANQYLNYLNARMPNDVLRIDRSAMALLQNYNWPGNYVQFERILSQAAASSRDHIIHANAIRQLLSQESVSASPRPPAGMNAFFREDRTLAEMEKDIIEQCLKQNDGNQSQTARQLGIGRTTLWRILNSGK